jgi:hypothetical protein
MRLEKPEPWKLIINSSALLLWLIGGAFSVGILFLLINLWIVADFALSQEVLALSLLLFLVFIYFSSSIRKPTIRAIFDKQNGYFTVEKKWIWSHQIIQHPITKIKSIQVAQKGRFGKARVYFKINVELFSGELVPISAMNYRPEGKVRMIANELIDFLETEKSSHLTIKEIKQDVENRLGSSLQ